MPQPQQKTCLTQTELQRYLDEHLSENEEYELQSHIGSCERCQSKLEQLAASRAVWDGLRSSMQDAPEADAAPDATLHGLIEHLAPSEDPKFLGRLGAYEVCGIIGQGSTGIVLKAFEPRLNRYIAIKVLSPTLASNGPARKRFEREGRAIASVSHEHVVPIYAVDDYRGLPYIVMQYIPGVSLLRRIKKSGWLNTCEVVRIGLQVASGLDAAHRQGIIHRDVKPANVILEDTVDRAMVTDFGLARVADEGTMTRTGTISGTPQYMSPEQARGDTTDERTDLFSLGSLLYTACTARPPFRAETVFGIIHRVCETEPRPVHELNPDIAPWLVEFIKVLMAKNPEKRFQSAAIVAQLLERELAHLQNPSTAAKPAREWMQPSRTGVTKGLYAPIRATLLKVILPLAVIVGSYLAWEHLEPRIAWLAPAVEGSNPFAKKKGEPARERMNPTAEAPSETSTEKETSQVNERKSNPSTATSSESDKGESDSLLIGGGTTVAPGQAPQVVWTQHHSDESALQQTYVQRIDQSFPVTNDLTIELKADRGDIEIRQTELDYASFVVLRRIQASNQAEAEKIAGYHKLSSDNRSGLRLQTTLDPEFAARGGEERFEKIVYGLSVPVGVDVDIETNEGAIRVESLVGNARAKSQMGDIRFGKIQGDLWARSTGGEIVARKGCTGKVDFMTTHGNICASDIEKKARLRSSKGNIYVGGNPGPTYAHATGGDLRIASILGRFSAHVESGDVYLVATNPLAADCDLSAASGNIHVEIPQDSAVTIMARGEYENRLPSAAEQDESSAAVEDWHKSEINGGGKILELVTTTGNITVDACKPCDEKESLGGSGDNQYFSLGGSGSHSERKKASKRAIAKSSGPARPGAIVPIEIEDGGNIDGYTLYVPVKYDESKSYPVILYLSGGYSVGGPITNINDWGLPRLIRDQHNLDTERNRLLLDSFIVISPHIQGGDYDDHPEVITRIFDEVGDQFALDRERIYLTGLSRGGHASWDLIEKLPTTFAATAPVGGRPNVDDFGVFENVAVWVAHNQGDPSVDWEDADAAARSIEKSTGGAFQRFEDPIPPGSVLEQEKYVFTQPKLDSHDAWTDLYTSAEFYQWLLLQERGKRQ